MMSFLRIRSSVLLSILLLSLLAFTSFVASMELEMEVESETELEAILADSLDNSPIPPAGAMQSPPPMAVQQTPVGATDPSGLTPAGTTPVGGEDQSEVGLCEVCMYVMENKMQHQPYLCKGLKDPHYQNICVQVMESLMWWISNQVYWVNYGCQMNQNGAISWVRPCPAHAVCSWLQHLYLRKPYCAPDKNFPKPA